jgi:hypothetical protein
MLQPLTGSETFFGYHLALSLRETRMDEHPPFSKSFGHAKGQKNSAFTNHRKSLQTMDSLV